MADGDILISTDQMVRGFTRWEELFRNDPEGFEDTVVRILRGDTPQEFGKACADYFRSLLIDVR